MEFSNIFLQTSFPKEKGVILNDTCRIVLLIALSILETLFLKLGGMYYIEIDKLRDYQQKLNIHHFLSCSIFDSIRYQNDDGTRRHNVQVYTNFPPILTK